MLHFIQKIYLKVCSVEFYAVEERFSPNYCGIEG